MTSPLRAAALLGLLLSGCASTSPSLRAARDPADPQLPTAALTLPARPASSPVPAAAGATTTHHHHAPEAEAEHGDWRCPMDAEVRAEGPGRCPVCGMALRRVAP